MKRDMRLIRKILEVMEAMPTEGGAVEIPGVEQDVVEAHIHLLEDFEAVSYYVKDDLHEDMFRLTWKGHDYLGHLRDEETASKYY